MTMEAFDKLNQISIRLQSGAVLLDILHDALENSVFSAEDYAPALYAAQDYISRISAELQHILHEQAPQAVHAG